MSASTERLVEQIAITEQAIATALAQGHDTTALYEDLKILQRTLVTCNNALNEGAQRVLKG